MGTDVEPSKTKSTLVTAVPAISSTSSSTTIVIQVNGQTAVEALVKGAVTKEGKAFTFAVPAGGKFKVSNNLLLESKYKYWVATL